MITYLSDRELDYDGSQLRSGFAAENFAIEGDSIVAFIGACDVSPDYMVDLEDLAAGAEIKGERMLQFIAEFGERDITLAVALERLIAALALEEVETISGRQLMRSGDDIYLGERKLSIGIATLGSAASLFHFAMNITTETVPVPAVGLSELGIEPTTFARTLMSAFKEEYESFLIARRKVRGVL